MELYTSQYRTERDEGESCYDHDRSTPPGPRVVKVLKMISFLLNVKSLNLSSVNTATLLHIGSECIQLKQLTVEKLYLDGIPFLSGFRNLERLVVAKEYAPLSLGAVTTLVSLPKLRHLSLKANKFSFKDLRSLDFELPKFHNLQRLELIGVWGFMRKKFFSSCSDDLTDIKIQHITDREMLALMNNCPNLKLVSMHPNPTQQLLSPSGYSRMFQRIGSQLVQLTLGGSPGAAFWIHHVKLLVKHNLPALKVLDLDIRGISSSNAFIPFFKKLGKQLEFCKITGTQLTDEALVVFAEECTDIFKKGCWADISESKYISFRGQLQKVISNSNISEAGISKFLQICGPGLQGLFVCGTAISDKNLEELALHCPNLQELDLGQCKEVTEDGVLNFLRQQKGLKVLGIARTWLAGWFAEIIIRTDFPDLELISRVPEVDDKYLAKLAKSSGWGPPRDGK